jgi:hypothetical protein
MELNINTASFVLIAGFPFVAVLSALAVGWLVMKLIDRT